MKEGLAKLITFAAIVMAVLGLIFLIFNQN
jgi:hypothetical protein